MYQHILIPTDGSDLSGYAIEHGLALAKAVGARVTALTLSPPLHPSALEAGVFADAPERYAERMRVLAESHLRAARDAARAVGVPCDGLHIEHDHPYRAIIETAARKVCDLIVMASHGRRGIAAVVLGSETVKVLTHSTVPVLVFPAPRARGAMAAS